MPTSKLVTWIVPISFQLGLPLWFKFLHSRGGGLNSKYVWCSIGPNLSGWGIVWILHIIWIPHNFLFGKQIIFRFLQPLSQVTIQRIWIPKKFRFWMVLPFEYQMNIWLVFKWIQILSVQCSNPHGIIQWVSSLKHCCLYLSPSLRACSFVTFVSCWKSYFGFMDTCCCGGSSCCRWCCDWKGGGGCDTSGAVSRSAGGPDILRPDSAKIIDYLKRRN